MKFRSLHLLPAIVALTAAFTACEDSTSPIGSSLSGNNVEIIMDSSFTISGNTYRVASVSPRTTKQIIGSITIDGYGTLSSEVVTQFLPSTMLDTVDFTADDVDSIALSLSYLPSDFIGDSVAPLGIGAYPLTRQLTADLTSAFDPTGYYENRRIGNAIYNASTLDDAATAKLSYRQILMKLPREMGVEMFKAFENNPADFADGKVFAQNVFPGVYLKNTFGSGRLTVVKSTGINFYFTSITQPNDTTIDTTNVTHQYMLVTPEVISNNSIKYAMAPELEARVAAGEDLLIAPIGTEVEFEFPIRDIVDSYRSQGGNRAVLNGLAMQLPADSIIPGVTTPPYVLMVLKKDRDEFFAKNKLADNITSFYAEYSSTYRRYAFTNMRQYLLDMLEKDDIAPDDYTFCLVPVQVEFEALVNSSYYSYSTSYTESEIQPYITGPVAARLHLDKAKIQLTFSRVLSGK